MSIKHLYPIAVAAVLACATAGSTGTTQKKTGTLLTAQEIADAHADITTAYDAVARLRPNWLAPHGAMSSNPEVSAYAAVWVDGQRTGLIETLKNVPAYYVVDMRYYDVTQAGARFGIRAGTGGAIEVRTK